MTNFELGTRVPLIVVQPSMNTAGQRTRCFVELVDLYPTLAECCELPQPKHLEGISFVPLLGNPNQPWKKAAFSQYLRPGKSPVMGRSIRTDRWRYTEWHDLKQNLVGIELYDEKNDPQENISLASSPDHAETLQSLSVQLKAGWKGALP
jgi:arylsulfatase A-like enzyme